MEFKAWFQCINRECGTKYPLNRIIYRCESCGSLLEVRHDMAALAAMIKLVKAGKIDKSELVVVVSTAHGLKFTEFKVDYHQGKLDFPSRYQNRPVEVRASVDAVKDALRHGMEDRRTADA